MTAATAPVCRKNVTGFTLVELVLVVAVLAVVASLAAMRLDGHLEYGRQRAAEHDLKTLREALLGSAALPGYLPDMEKLPGFSPAYVRVHNLLGATNVLGRRGVWLDDGHVRRGYANFAAFTNWNAELERGWRGPYIRGHLLPARVAGALPGSYPMPHERRCAGDATFAERGFMPQLPPSLQHLPPQATPYALVGDLALMDPWGNPYILQVPPAEAFNTPTDALRFQYARLVSAGPDGVLDTPCFNFTAPPYRPRRRWRRRERPEGETRPWFNYAALSAVEKRQIRLAGRLDDGSADSRGDDLVLFINRADIYEPEE